MDHGLIARKILCIIVPGKTFSVLGVADNAIPLISGVLYSKLYNATIHTHPEAIFYLTMGSQIAVFLLVVYIQFIYKEDHGDIDEGVQSDCLEDNQSSDRN